MSSSSLPAGQVVGPALHFGGTYTDRIKTFHTMDPAYSANYRMYPTVNNIVAMQQLNQQGLFPTGNPVVDFSGGAYPADIPLQPRQNAPAGCGVQYGQGFTDYRGNEARQCHACAPLLGQTPMSKLVERPSVSNIKGAAVAPVAPSPRDIGAMSTMEVQQFDRAHFGSAASEYGGTISVGCGSEPATFAYAQQSCGRSIGDIVQRSTSAGCASYQGAMHVGGVPASYNERHPQEDDHAASYVGYVDVHPQATATRAAPVLASAPPAAPGAAGAKNQVQHPDVQAAAASTDAALAAAHNGVAHLVADAQDESVRAQHAASQADMTTAVAHAKNADVKNSQALVLKNHLSEAERQKQQGQALAAEGQTTHAIVALNSAKDRANHVNKEANKLSKNAAAASALSSGAVPAAAAVSAPAAAKNAGSATTSLGAYKWS